jgi:glycosyltransferase involved in cell wall biosynthesis
VRQHIESLKELGIAIREYVPAINKYGFIPGWPRQVNPLYVLPVYGLWQGAKLVTRLPGIVGSWHSQITWLERQLLAGCSTLEWSLKRPLVFDVDDAIWLTPPFRHSASKSIAQRSDVVIAGNSFLADWFSKYARDVRILPTAVDTGRMKPRTRITDDSPFVVGWTGLGSNLPYLYAIEKPLRHFMNAFSDVEMYVITDEYPRFKSLPPERVRFIRWSHEVEVTAVQQVDVGLMPLPDNEWTRGKCSFKMLQYMACGIPSIVSPVGMNAEVLALGNVGLPAVKNEDWYAALEYFYLHRSHARECGEQGRKVVESHFSQKVISEQLAQIFREVA